MEALFSGSMINEDDKLAQLNIFRRSLSIDNYPGYPKSSDRLIIEKDRLTYSNLGRLILKNGPWEINSHSNRSNDNESVPELDQQGKFLKQNLKLDSRGRPLHPFVIDMLTDPKVGIVTGKGFYWRFGKNPTADAVVIHKNKALIVLREDTKHWALPGGFIDENEDPLTASTRELFEETGVILPSRVKKMIAYEGPVVDLRATANAWPYTTAVTYEVEDYVELNSPEIKEEVIDVKWEHISNIIENKLLFGAHSFLFKKSMEQISII